MKKMPSRDVTGHCTGECRDLVREGEENRQKIISKVEYSGGSTRSVFSAKSRNEAPGFYGGHV